MRLSMLGMESGLAGGFGMDYYAEDPSGASLPTEAGDADRDERGHYPKGCRVVGCTNDRFCNRNPDQSHGGAGYCATHARAYFRHGHPLGLRWLSLDRLGTVVHEVGDAMLRGHVDVDLRQRLAEAASSFAESRGNHYYPVDPFVPSTYIDGPSFTALLLAARNYTECNTEAEDDMEFARLEHDLHEAAKRFHRSLPRRGCKTGIYLPLHSAGASTGVLRVSA